MNKSLNNCRVCGLYIEDAPWGANNDTPTYEICPCCGVEFGNEDYRIESIKAYRDEWISNGCKWFNSKKEPPNWNFEIQSQQIPEQYR